MTPGHVVGAMTMMNPWHASRARRWTETVGVGALMFAMATAPAALAAQTSAAPAQTPSGASGPEVPADYVIGPEDVLTVNFRNDKDLNTEVVVRPEGKISLQLIGDVAAAGLTIDELRVKLNAAYAAFIKGDPAVSVQSKVIKSRKVSIVGEVTRQGEYPLLGPTDVLQLLAQAGGLTVYANKERILIIRTVNGRATTRTFNYSQVEKGQRLEQNIVLQPGDRVIVPE